MPPIRSLVFKCCVLLISSIALNGEIMSPCFYYLKKGLVYIAIADPSNHQSSSYSKCIKSNTCILCDVHSVLFNKYMFFTCFISL